jgi:hypothetical protein
MHFLASVASAKTIMLATFDGVKETSLTWSPVNDPVMGGQSTSKFSVEEPLGIFEGEVKIVPSLGAAGFCNLETTGTVSFPDVSGTDGITVAAKQTMDDGLANFDVRFSTTQTNAARRGAAWEADFKLVDGQESQFVSYSDFTCQWRGQKLTNCGNIEEQLSSVQQLVVGSGGVAGPFRLELSSLAATSKPSETSADEVILESFAVPAGNVRLASFNSDDAEFHQWVQKNDPVMGGASRGTFEIVDNTGVMNGTVALIPSLQAPGFIKTLTNDQKAFADVSSCTGLELTTKSVSTPGDYTGYRVSFGSDSAFMQCGKYFARGFKADFTAGEGEFKTVQVPFNQFTKCWDDSTGDAIHTCAEDARFCPSSERLADLQTMSLWAEGHAADVTLTIQSIDAYGCDANTVV